jgi:hypothetical protein
MRRVHTATTIEAATVLMPPRDYLSHEGPAGRFVGSDVRCIDCSFFHFSLRDPVWQQRQSRTENSNLHMAQNHPRGPFCRLGASETRSRQYILCRSAPKKGSATRSFPVADFFVLKLAGIHISLRAQSPSPIQRVVWFIRNRWLVAEICPFPVFDTRPRPN